MTILFFYFFVSSVTWATTNTADNKTGTIPVDLQLLLAVDVSQSIDSSEAQLQRNGYIEVLRDPEIINVIRSGFHGKVALSYMEWAGPLQQWLLVDWHIIDGRAAADKFVEKLIKSPIHIGQRTSISFAVLHAVSLFSNTKYSPTRKVIDVSGDGANNAGFYIHETRHRAVENGITINGLAIVNERPSPLGIPATRNIDDYYEDCVIAGPGSFLVVADNLNSFAAAVRRKMILEIAGITVENNFRKRQNRLGYKAWLANMPLQPADCLIGEKQLEHYKKSRP